MIAHTTQYNLCSVPSCFGACLCLFVLPNRRKSCSLRSWMSLAVLGWILVGISQLSWEFRKVFYCFARFLGLLGSRAPVPKRPIIFGSPCGLRWSYLTRISPVQHLSSIFLTSILPVSYQYHLSSIVPYQYLTSILPLSYQYLSSISPVSFQNFPSILWVS